MLRVTGGDEGEGQLGSAHPLQQVCEQGRRARAGIPSTETWHRSYDRPELRQDHATGPAGAFQGPRQGGQAGGCGPQAYLAPLGLFPGLTRMEQP